MNTCETDQTGSATMVDYEKLFDSVVKRVRENYLPGAIPFAEKNRQELLDMVDEIENCVNYFWGLSLTEFQAALREWEEKLIEISAAYRDFKTEDYKIYKINYYRREKS